MEERLGVCLFHRSTRSITLIAEGALLLERCLRIFLKSKRPSLHCRSCTRPRAAPYLPAEQRSRGGAAGFAIMAKNRGL